MSNSKSIMSQNNPFIPLHVVVEILLNLDAQTLIQHACLCRDWNSLITSPDFISRHSNRTLCSRKEVILAKFLRCKDRKWSGLDTLAFEESYSLHLDNDQFDLIRTTERPTINGPKVSNIKVSNIVGASNGLVCLVDYPPLDFVLWNPTIQRYISLPTPPVTSPREISLVGFGFDHRSNDFKVVIIVYHNYKVNLAWVFSYHTWSWKLVTNTPPPFLVNYHVHDIESKVVINGILHWIVRNIARDYKFVITFDLSREVFGKILLPSSIANDVPISIFAADDSIAVSVRKNIFGGTIWFVWVMKQYGFYESWTNTVTTHELLPEEGVGHKKDRDMVLQLRGGQILRYNPSTRTINVLRGITPLRPLDEAVFIGSYKENLYLLDKGEHVNSK